MIEDIALFKGLTQSMDWLTTRQRVIAQNIANANTPDYQARDLKPADFSKTLGSLMGKQSLARSTQQLPMDITSNAHMDKKLSVGRKDSGQPSDTTYEVTPDSNGVELEEQMMKSSETAGKYQMVANLYAKNMAMMKIAVSSR